MPPFIGCTNLKGGFFVGEIPVVTCPCDLSERCLRVADYMLTHRSTVRQAARAYGLSKSAVHKDMLRRLPGLDRCLARQVASLLQYNKSVRHLRGGAATREKFLHQHDADAQ